MLTSITAPQGISIHALRGEGDATAAGLEFDDEDFNPRPPWGGRLTEAEYQAYLTAISIHALRGEGDCRSTTLTQCQPRFQSTPSVGRATRQIRSDRRRA